MGAQHDHTRRAPAAAEAVPGFTHQIGISENLIAFIGFDESFNQAGLFGFANGSLFRIAGTGDTKKENGVDESKTVSTVDFQPDAIDGNVLAYTAYFTDGSSAAYLVAVALPVPEPAAWLLFAVGLAVVLDAHGSLSVTADSTATANNSGRNPIQHCGGGATATLW